MSEAEWQEQRKEARRLENDIELKLVSYTKLGQSLAAQQSNAAEEQALGSSSLYQISHSMSVEIEQLLSDVSHYSPMSSITHI